MEIKTLVRAARSAQYDGTNGAELVAHIGGIVESDDGTTLEFSADPSGMYGTRTATVGQWVTWIEESGPEAVLGVSDELPRFPFVELGS